MTDVYSIIQGIHNAALLGIDGNFRFQSPQVDEDLKVGILRDEGNPILDSRVIDGFKVGTVGNLLKISYQSECTLAEVHGARFEEDIVGRIDEITSFLKKEYKNFVGEALKLKMIDEPHIDVRHMSNTRTWIEAFCIYEITSMDFPEGDEYQDKFKKNFDKWLKQQEK